MSLPSSRLPIALQTQLDDRGFGLAAIPDHAAVSLVVVDKDCLIQRANTAIYALAGFRGVLRDISERKQIEARSGA